MPLIPTPHLQLCTMLATTGGPTLQCSFLGSLRLRLRPRNVLNGVSHFQSTPHQTVVPGTVTPLIPVRIYSYSARGSLSTCKIWGARYFSLPLFYPKLIYFVDVFEYRRHDVSNSCMWNGRFLLSIWLSYNLTRSHLKVALTRNHLCKALLRHAPQLDTTKRMQRSNMTPRDEQRIQTH